MFSASPTLVKVCRSVEDTANWWTGLVRHEMIHCSPDLGNMHVLLHLLQCYFVRDALVHESKSNITVEVTYRFRFRRGRLFDLADAS
jgi:hypothetical protein